jgi:hypothetical protein
MASLKRDEIFDNPGSSSVLAPTLKRTPIYAYQDFSYAEDNYVTSGTYKVPLVHQLNKTPIQYKGPLRLGNKGCLTYRYSGRNRSSTEGLEGLLQRL